MAESLPTSSQTVIQNQSENLDAVQISSIREIVSAYLEQIDTDFDDTERSLLRLEENVATFLASPSTGSMNSLRSAWLNAHSAYELTSLHRYYLLSVLSDSDSLVLNTLQQQLNQWPILPGYIDYVGSYLDSGIVNDITVDMDLASMRQQHSAFDLAEAALGFHVVEFLIWGTNADKISPRPASDYQQEERLTAVQQENGILLRHLPNNRRRQLLSLTAQAMLEEFSAINSLWQQKKVELENSQAGMSGDALLDQLISTITTMLSEEILVRSLYPLLNGDFTDSVQSPYSHSTQNAVAAQLSSIENLLRENRTTTGLALDSILVEVSVDFEEFFYQSFDANKECLVLLYSTLEAPESVDAAVRAEFETVECINLLTNMIDHLKQTQSDA